MKFDIEYYSDIGKRNENQDSFLFKQTDEDTLISCIADGVGGKLGGSKASKFSVNHFIDTFPNNNLDNISLSNKLLQIHYEIINEAKLGESYGMATTFSGIIIKNSKLIGIHTGDTRVCILRGNGIKQLTDDHTEVARFVREGKLSFHESLSYSRRNIIESALGIIDHEPILQEFNFDLLMGDRIIMTTDGVHENISKRDFRDISLKSKTSKDFLDILTVYLKRKQPNDNNTILVITISN
ncbi:hypothetical protein OA93_06435 [Flavobacterium sp. KMS]|uniref:PP2C family protein-serine/threonine phosphatase n=1 Tax=Flavobacterium sp. KMS TaxID=1566023 RepID=UPI00057F2DF2|nr:PP2C family serine/threonine-protein phosphatase [Flavobacterium sp. KMS]KIA99261.1 hypothetical protein OA93_06435 [Flavobacterium sp. KMS]